MAVPVLASDTQDQGMTYGNHQGCAVHFGRATGEATDQVILQAGELRFYEIACKIRGVGKQNGRVASLSAQCMDYDGPYDFTWSFRSDGQDGFVLATPDGSYSTVLRACR